MTKNSISNYCISAPGLAIKAGGGVLVKYANTFAFLANGRLSASITTADAPSLALATIISPLPNGTATVAGNLATGNYRIYTLIGTLPINGTGTVTPTFSWLASADFSATTDLVDLNNASFPNQSNQTVLGFVIVSNATGSDFVPNTTALDTGSLTVRYIDNYAQLQA